MRVKKTILAVDDNPINLGILEEILAGDYRLKFAQNGQQAIQIAEECRPAIILLDVKRTGRNSKV